MESPESVPYDEIEALCRLVGVRFEVYDVKGSLRRVIAALTKPIP